MLKRPRVVRLSRPPELLSLLALCLGAVFAIRGFWRAGVSDDGDMLMAVYRLFELDQSWHGRVFFPRLSNGINYGFSGPLFQYYPPLFSYLALPFHWLGLGWIESVKAVFTIGLFLAGVGAYAYAHWLFNERRAALVAGFAYSWAPFLLLDIYERGAASEFLALALLPWVFWATHHLLRSTGRAWVWASAVLVASLILAHNVTALFVIPLLGFYLILMAWNEHVTRRLPAVALAFGLGLGLSAFYWFPALGELGYVSLERTMLTEGYQAESNLLRLQDFVQPSLAFDYWGRLRFHLGLGQALLAMVSVVAIVVQPKPLRRTLGILAGALALVLFLQLDLSRPFWQAVPLVRYIQFPWRLLGLAAFFVALLGGSVLCWRRLGGSAGWVVAALIVALVFYAGGQKLDLKLSPLWYRITSTAISQEGLYEIASRPQGYPLYIDYAPISLTCDLKQSRPDGVPAPPPPDATPALQVISESANSFDLRVHAPAPFLLRLPRVYFPGWQVRAGGRPAQTGPGGFCGLVRAAMPAGDYEVTAQFADTPLRRVATITSSLCLLVLIAGSALARPSSTALWVGGALIGLLVLLLSFHQGLGQAARRPVAYAAKFGDEITLLGYYLERSAVEPGDTMPLRLYWLADKTPGEDYTVFVHLVKPDDSGKVAQDDSQPVQGFAPTRRWDPGDFVVDQHQIHIANDVPPGTYRVAIGMYRPSTLQNLPVTEAAEVLPGDRVALAEIEVRGK